ncbi:uncharacterized protein LOC111328557 [Stylophora pistillata]|nr:uncharacterized protein LOC111328557 [Stylophora pistillata]
MALKQLPKNSCSKDDFQLFGTNMNFQPTNDIPNPPDSRKKAVQHDKVAPRYEESFVQPEPPKKQKVIHPSHVAQGQDQSQIGNTSDDIKSQVLHGGSFLQLDSRDSGSSDEKSKLEVVLRELGQDMKMVHLKWAQPFAEGESFEGYCPIRLDELLKEALRLEQHLEKQKERLRERLTLITKTLQMPTMQ